MTRPAAPASGEQGIARLWEREGLPEQLDDYLDVIRHLNPDGSLRYYRARRNWRGA